MSANAFEQTFLREKWTRIARHFLGIDAEIITAELVGGGFSLAEVVRIETVSGSYLLRKWSFEAMQQTFPIPRIQELHRFLEHLERYGIPVALPLRTRNLPNTIVPDGSDIWHCEPWLSGVALNVHEITSIQITSMMENVACLHLAAATFPCSSLGRNWFRCETAPCPAIEERFKIIQQLTPNDLNQYRTALAFASDDFAKIGCRILDHFQTLVSQVRGELQLYYQTPFPLHPCWRDLWSEHLLFEGDRVTGFIDPTATRTDHVATDLSRLLGSFFADDQAQWKFALEAYEQVRPLAPPEHALLRVLDQSSVLLSGITWLKRWSDRELDQTQLVRVIPRLKKIEQRLFHLRFGNPSS